MQAFAGRPTHSKHLHMSITQTRREDVVLAIASHIHGQMSKYCINNTAIEGWFSCHLTTQVNTSSPDHHKHEGKHAENNSQLFLLAVNVCPCFSFGDQVVISTSHAKMCPEFLTKKKMNERTRTYFVHLNFCNSFHTHTEETSVS